MTENETIERIKHRMHTVEQVAGENGMEDLEMAIKALEEVQQYRAIGTPEECRAAVEKQKAKRPDGGRDIDGKDYLICPNCCAIVADGEWTAKFCPDCGQKLDWSGEE